jgi:hypothetical protein
MDRQSTVLLYCKTGAKQMSNEWIMDLKRGDVVFIDHGMNKSPVIVERVTPTQIVISINNKYNRKTGRKVGHQLWDRSKLAIASQEDLNIHYAMARRNILVSKLRTHDYDSTLLRDINIVCTVLGIDEDEDE